MDSKAYPLPGYPTHKVVDPTGAGDSFAGALMGYLASKDASSSQDIRRAIAYGTVTASIELEDFSLNRFLDSTRETIDDRLKEFEDLTRF
jgi:sugar/nucleoside kinase (ribokinase family)